MSFLVQKLKEKERELEKRKESLNSKDERMQKTHKYNDIKDMCGVVFQRLAEIEGKMIQEVYEEFGVERK